MKPGDLIRPRKWNISYAVPIDYLDIWDRPDGEETRQKKWEHGEVGLLLDGRYCGQVTQVDDMVMLEVLFQGEKWWVLEDEVEVAK